MIHTPFDIIGKTAIVTGASRGLGQAMAVGLAEAGADIAAVGSSPGPYPAKDLVEELGRAYLEIQADLSTTDSISAILNKTVEAFGKVDILVNNAGIIRREDAIDFSEQDWDDVVDLNLKTTFFLCQAVARQFMRQSGGKIINIASMLSFQGGIRVPSYTASKSGLLGLTRLMANEWGASGINVNAIAPGYMATDNTAALRADKGRQQEIVQRIPAGRWGEPEDLQGPVVFLASDASGYMHGHTLAVDGGWLAR